MNHILLQKDGSLIHHEKHVEDEPLLFLGCKVEIEKGCTLRSYFDMLGRYPSLAKINPFLYAYMEQYRRASKKECIPPGLDYLELSKTIEMIGYPGKPRLEIYISFHGVQSNAPCEIKHLCIEDLLDTQVLTGKLKHIVFGDKINIFEFDTVLSLFEFIDSIAWDLSFHNTPVQCTLRR